MRQTVNDLDREVVMARGLVEKANDEPLENHTVSSTIQHESTCVRCGGLMVNDSYIDLLNSFGESKFVAKRCVQCGEVVDPVILQNRGARQEPMTVQLAGQMMPNNYVTQSR